MLPTIPPMVPNQLMAPMVLMEQILVIALTVLNQQMAQTAPMDLTAQMELRMAPMELMVLMALTPLMAPNPQMELTVVILLTAAVAKTLHPNN